MRFSFWKHHPVSDQFGLQLAQEALDFQNIFDFDFLKLTPAGDWLAVCYGAKDEVWENDSIGRRKITEFAIHKPQDFYQIKPFSFNESILIEVLKAIDICCTNTNVPVYITVFCPLSQLIQISGLDLFLAVAKTEPEAIFYALDMITLNTIKVIEEAVKRGVKGLYYVTQHMQKNMLTIEQYSQFGKTFDEKCLVKSGELLDSLIFHLHGDEPYACIPSNISKLNIHCTYNTTTNSIIESIGYPVIYGIPASVLVQVNSVEECKEIASQYPIHSILTCECVLPLDFPSEKIQIWKDFVYSIEVKMK